MDTRYSDGLKREAVAMRSKGLPVSHIAISLGVTLEFIDSAWGHRQAEPGRNWEPDYDDASETGGY